MSKRINWSGVFPAVTTQFNDDFTINLEKTHQVISNVIRDGVSGLVVCCLLYTSPSPRDRTRSRMPSSA